MVKRDPDKIESDCSIQSSKTMRNWYIGCALGFHPREGVSITPFRSNVYNKYVPYLDKNKQRECGRDFLSKRREEWLLENGPCAKCGSREDLEVDHKDPLLKISHKVWSWSEKRRKEELSKCQPLCVSCHKDKTKLSRIRDSPHGTASCYRKGCRCLACRKYQSDRMDAYHRKNPR